MISKKKKKRPQTRDNTRVAGGTYVLATLVCQLGRNYNMYALIRVDILCIDPT